jgi:hypothetical protein
MLPGSKPDSSWRPVGLDKKHLVVPETHGFEPARADYGKKWGGRQGEKGRRKKVECRMQNAESGERGQETDDR